MSVLPGGPVLLFGRSDKQTPRFEHQRAAGPLLVARRAGTRSVRRAGRETEVRCGSEFAGQQGE